MRVACAQLDVVFADPIANAARAVAELEKLARDGVDAVVFPEAFLTGYCARSAAEVRQIAIPPEHSAVISVAEASRRLGILTVVGFAEVWGEKVANSAAIILPERTAIYRKTHLPELGMDKFVTPGDDLPIFQTDKGVFGVLICFDQRLPEPARTLALKGAEIIFLPTNWPEGALFAPSFIAPVRAAENRVFLATCNRVGRENGFGFIGQSGIFGPTGAALAKAGSGEEAIVADLDLAEARDKQTVVIPGEYEMNGFSTRRPELYGPITDS